jgi:hypothetical protein
MHVLQSSITYLFTNLTYFSLTADLTCLSTTRDVVFNATPVVAKSLEDAASGANNILARRFDNCKRQDPSFLHYI